ncbi:MAG: UDP-N-acetylmuramoyl-L-alanyl-D-glutamate--2,6-diaminopimelate ligase, partial [Oleiphilaceae bacterium]|nr:UDP-N-acetylmuramoyl-L-alanyl-D-glutamate--2,6-diaminopimelate ligase [Oleiphilaceae bacterium]
MHSKTHYSAMLSSLLTGIGSVPAALDTRVHGLALDSRRVKSGDLFLAVSGLKSGARDHIDDALARGAVAVVVEAESNEVGQGGLISEDGDAVEVQVPDLKRYLGEIAARFFEFPSRDMKVIGVTGTNGKSSVTHYIAQYLTLCGEACGVIGTLGYGMPYGVEPFEEEVSHTTPDVVALQFYLATLRDAGAAYVAIEVSSHGLDQGRVDGVEFYGAVFTNLTRDHLDYHQSMEAYAAAKRRLFERTELLFAALNSDDPASETMRLACAADTVVYQFGLGSDCEIRASKVDFEQGIQACIHRPDGEMPIRSTLVGSFNLSNVLATATVGLALGLPVSSLAHLQKLRAIPGRMQCWQENGSPQVVVDYAHTPDALQNVLSALRSQSAGSLLVVFGCGGDRDRGKRAQMGRIASELADFVLLCDDNPRTEDPEQITRDILQGISARDNCRVVHDRADAITHALATAQAGDVVLIAGKGHETYQEQNGKRRDFNDLLVARECWQKLQQAKG